VESRLGDGANDPREHELIPAPPSREIRISSTVGTQCSRRRRGPINVSIQIVTGEERLKLELPHQIVFGRELNREGTRQRRKSSGGYRSRIGGRHGGLKIER
ncbi:hypothetical protein LINPERHAP2_LOCUS7503, partial [Linum perenne]